MDPIISYGGVFLVIGAGSALLFCSTLSYLAGLRHAAKGATRRRRDSEETAEWQAHALREAVGVTAQDRDRLNAILSSIGEGIIVLDMNRAVVLMNQVAGIMLRIAPAEAVGKPLEHVCEVVQQRERTGALEPRRELLASIFRRVTEEVAIEATRLSDYLYCRKTDGTIFPTSFVMAPLLQVSKMAVGGAIFVFRDVTEEKRVDEAKSEFVSLVSHQLRTPLSTIGVNLELLCTEGSTALSREQTVYVDEMQAAVQAMTGLIVDLLEISRIDLGIVETMDDAVDVTALADEQISLLESTFRTKNLSLERLYPAGGIQAVTSKRWLQIIMQNVLSNAAKYTSRDGGITVEFKDEKTNFLFSVRDTGWGIPHSEQGRIFERFFRASNAKKKDPSGTGLGLYVTRRFVENLGGTIWFESDKDHGSVFYVRLPKKGRAQGRARRKLSVGVPSS